MKCSPFTNEVGSLEQLLTLQEVAKYLKLTEVTVYKYVREGKIPGVKVASRWRFDKDRIDDLLKSKEESNKTLSNHVNYY